MALFGRGGIVTAGMLSRARSDVWRELLAAGLATDALARVRVTRPWVQLGNRVGYYVYGGAGEIAVPAVSAGRLWEYTGQAAWTGVRDILRHEYAHALADLHPELVECEAFRACFGAGHDDDAGVEAYDPDAHATDYAATSPSEDFAETMMLFLRVRGDVAAFASRRALSRKLAFVGSLGTRLRAARRLTAGVGERYRSPAWTLGA